jgi:hypothetical protein
LENPGPVFGQAHKYGGVKLVNVIPGLPIVDKQQYIETMFFHFFSLLRERLALIFISTFVRYFGKNVL